MIVADMHEALLNVMQEAGTQYLTQRRFTLGNLESVQAFHEYVKDELRDEMHEREDELDLVEITINDAIAHIKEDERGWDERG